MNITEIEVHNKHYTKGQFKGMTAKSTKLTCDGVTLHVTGTLGRKGDFAVVYASTEVLSGMDEHTAKQVARRILSCECPTINDMRTAAREFLD